MIFPEWLIARTVLTEAVRRKEIYVLVLLSCVLIAVVMATDFFELGGLTKFYREFALKVMSASTAAATIILSCRQLPREFEKRTIYPLLARPLSRMRIILGKYLGVWLASVFCLMLFAAIYVAGVTYLKGELHPQIFAQYVYLQMLLMLLLSSLGFALSMSFNADASITLGLVLYTLGATLSSMLSYLYDSATEAARWGFVFLTYVIPQVSLLDLSEKTVHAEAWGPLNAHTIAELTLYASVYIGLYLITAVVLFRRRPI